MSAPDAEEQLRVTRSPFAALPGWAIELQVIFDIHRALQFQLKCRFQVINRRVHVNQCHFWLRRVSHILETITTFREELLMLSSA